MPRRLLILMAGVALVVAADLLLGGAVRALLRTGTCSSNGYSSQLGGPVQTCPKGSGLYSVYLPISLLMAILGAAVLPNPTQWYGFASYFSAMGIGALSVEFGDGPKGTSPTFLNVFGGAFLVVGVAGIAATAWFQLRRPPSRQVAVDRHGGNPLTSLGAAVLAAGVSAAVVIALLVATAPGSTVRLASTTAHPGGATGGPTAAPSSLAIAQPSLSACDLLSPAVARRAIGADARRSLDRPADRGASECDYRSPSSSRVLRVEVVDDASLVLRADPTARPISGFGDEAYLSASGNGLAIRDAARGIRITVLVPDGTRSTPASRKADSATVERVARSVLALVT